MQPQLKQAISQLNRVILGKETQIQLALVSILAKGHLLIEDLPGMGKTTLAHTLAKVLGLDFQRIQFTNDLLPADIIGSAIYQRSDEQFKFHQGPIFTQLLLADEINRATPKSQSALLEAMEEYQVTSEGVSRKLPEPFFVIATQNPFHQIGTYPLPESQLDRFLVRISLGYPAQDIERALFKGVDTRSQIAQLSAQLTHADLQAMQQQVERVTMSDTWLDYLQLLLAASRNTPHWPHGLSPRGGLALIKASKAWAFLDGRNYLVPEDLQAVWAAVAGHRLVSQNANYSSAESPVIQLLNNTPVPR